MLGAGIHPPMLRKKSVHPLFAAGATAVELIKDRQRRSPPVLTPTTLQVCMHASLVRPLLSALALATCTLSSPEPAYAANLQGTASKQRPPLQLSSGEILHQIRQLGVCGSVLYLAAHPDDENTRLISYLSKGRQVRTAYMSLTRGDGGQNLIGPELGDGLGVLRTQELMEARRVDGGEQFFSRAVDFGYSKSPEETLRKWGREEVLADVVRVVRTFRPDIIVTRFDTDGSGGHGHHTASALLAREAFDLAADPEQFSEQIAEGLEPWQATRLFFNASVWWKRNLQKEVLENSERWVAVEVGGYDPLLGKSYGEIAGLSRSQHRSQGFGSVLRRGSQLEYLRLDLGEECGSEAPADKDLFTGIDPTWNRVAGAEEVGSQAAAIAASFDPSQPEESLPGLVQFIHDLDALAASGELGGPGSAWAAYHGQAARELALQVAGAVCEAEAPGALLPRGSVTEISILASQRSTGSFLKLVDTIGPSGFPVPVDKLLPSNEELSMRSQRAVDPAAVIDQPYWLAAPHGNLYDPRRTGHVGVEPFSRSTSLYRFRFQLLGDETLEVTRPLMRTWVERVEGQRTRPAVVTPIASIAPREPVVIVTGGETLVTVELESLVAALDGQLSATVPEGWTIVEAAEPTKGLAKNRSQRLSIRLRRGSDALAGPVRFSFEGALGSTTRTMHLLDYTHILPQVWYSEAKTRVVPLDVTLSVENVGYVKGAGDDLPLAMQRMGLKVRTLDPATAEPEDLARCESIVVGIRAYNAVPEMARLQPLLMDFVEAGGTLLVQYNTASRDMVIDPAAIGPYPFALTRGRVTVEEAEATLLAPEHSLLTFPNQISGADFDAWVQERGLYFAGDLDPAYTPLISWSDPGEAPLNGALIAADHGKGRFIYTGISLFRQLPAGVPGAYRLLANLLARRDDA